MASFNDSLTRIRRFLRDPTGDIWDSEQIRLYWNDAQLEIATKINYIERMHAYCYPPKWTWTYIYDHEYAYCEGDRYATFHNFGSRDMVVTYAWEPAYMLSSLDYPDDGTRFSHPWEAQYCTPADVVKIPLHGQFHKMKFAAFDESKIEPSSEKEIAENDGFYKTVTGEPESYYRPSEQENTCVLYPRPSSVTWDENDLFSNIPSDSLVEIPESDHVGIEKIVNGGFDADTDWTKGAGWTIAGGKAVHSSGTAEIYQNIYPNLVRGNYRAVITISECTSGSLVIYVGSGNGTAISTNGIHTQYIKTTAVAQFTLIPSTDFNGKVDDFSVKAISGIGIVSYQSDSFDENDTGIVLDTIDADGQLLMIFEALPDAVEDEIDTWAYAISWWPPYMLPMIEYATLERCFGADTDGFIPSLRDYWEMRKKIGIETVKAFKQLKLQDRDYRLGGHGRHFGSSHPRFPSGYPAVYP